MSARYGASPWHLAGHLALLALAGWALAQVFGTLQAAGNVVAWLVGAVVAHDLLLLPAYSGLDRIVARVGRRAVNHLRVPLGLSLLLGLVYFPVISGDGAAAFHNASGLRYAGYAGRWLLVSAALFGLSGLVFVARRRAVANSAMPASKASRGT
jgi:hypothetical protein